MIRPSKNHKLKPLGVLIFFRTIPGGFGENLKNEGVKLTPLLVFPGFTFVLHSNIIMNILL